MPAQRFNDRTGAVKRRGINFLNGSAPGQSAKSELVQRMRQRALNYRRQGKPGFTADLAQLTDIGILADMSRIECPTTVAAIKIPSIPALGDGGDERYSAWLENPAYLANESSIIGNVLDDLMGKDDVDGRVGKGEPRRIADNWLDLWESQFGQTSDAHARNIQAYDTIKRVENALLDRGRKDGPVAASQIEKRSTL